MINRENESQFLLKNQKVASGRIQLVNVPGRIYQVLIQEPNSLFQLPDPFTPLHDFHIQVLEVPLRLEEGTGTEGDLLDQVQLHHIKVLRELLLKL